MAEKMKQRCIYCGGDIYYRGSEQLVKCSLCGHTLIVAKFENEIARMKKTEEENALVREKLAEAEKEKQAAEGRLFAALSSLGEIQNDQDVLGRMLHALSGGQGEALQRLQLLQEVSGKLADSQDDIVARLGVMQEIAAHLQQVDMDAKERQSLISDFMIWSQQIHEDDIVRLQSIESHAAKLLKGQQEILDKVSELQKAADQHQQALKAFHGEYTKDKLKELRQLFRQAEGFQQDRVFDKAEKYYRKVLVKGGEDAEVYWRLLMCHYCLSYQKDDDGNLIPIILNPDLTDPAELSLRRELEQHLTGKERQYYMAELDKIDRILDKYRQLKDQVHCDVFISVKQGRSGRYTADSDVASDLYDFLSGQGLRVFNSRRTAIPAGQEYEPYIISALMSAKVMIVVGTKADHMNAQWVRNEWSRFQWLQRRDEEMTGKTGRVLICYLAKGMQAKQIPKALNPSRQAIIDGVKAHDNLLESLAFLLPSEASKDENAAAVPENPETAFYRIENQMTAWLTFEKYDKVLEKYEQLTDEGLFLTHASLHLAALCAKKQVSEIQQLVCSETALEKTTEFKLARKLCRSEEDKLKLKELLLQNREWNADKKEQKAVKETKQPDSTKEPVNRKSSVKPAGDITSLKQAAESGDAQAQHQLGLCYEEGKGTAKNRKSALKWYLAAAEQGLAEAQDKMGSCYENGNGVTKDLEEAVTWYRKAAQKGYAPAQYHLGSCYENGKGVKKSLATALKWYTSAAEQGDAQHQYALAKCYDTSNRAGRYEDALKWYNKAAKQGYTSAQMELARHYDKGIGVSKDEKKAFQWYLKAASQGDQWAQNEAGKCYETGKGVTQDLKLAVTWYQKAAENGNAESQYHLAKCYQSGTGVSKDVKESYRWFKKAAEAGFAQAYCGLGLCYETGCGTATDRRKALSWYQKASECGDTEAAARMGLYYENGWVVAKDMAKALELYRKSAEQGNLIGQYRYALYLKDKSPSEAAQWLKRAAAGGHSHAQYELGKWYEKGFGVPKNKQYAIEWYQEAADQGIDFARSSLERLTKKRFLGIF